MATNITEHCQFGEYAFYTYDLNGSKLIHFIIPVDTELKPSTDYVVNFPSDMQQIFLISVLKINQIITDGSPSKFTYSDDSIQIYNNNNYCYIRLANGAITSINYRGVNTAVGIWFQDPKGNIITRDSTYYQAVEWVDDGTGTPLSIHGVTTDAKGYVITGLTPRATWFTSPYYINSTESNINAYRAIIGKSSLYDVNDADPNTESSSGGGGGGTGKAGGDTNEDDGLPSLSATDCGLLTAFSVNKATLTALGNYLWSDSFDINTFKKMFNDPFDAILGLQMIPITPTDVTAGNIIFGNTDTGISANIINNQWISVDMGTLDLREIYNGALDYEPTTQVSIYLPYIGVRQLNTVDVMASSLHLIYKFDVLTGSVIAQLYVNHQFRNNTSGDFSGWTKNQGFLYSFEGQCSCNVPLSSQDYSNIVRSAISGVGMAAGAAASVATGNPAIGATTLAVGMANSGIQAQGSVIERSGHLSGTQGFLDYQTPMLFVIRPHRDKPSKYYNYRGVPSQTTATLANCSGYTQIADGVTISAAGATQAELDELTTLCRQGVIL